jgi:hypothetical protein
VELAQSDLRYEGCRLKSPAAEAPLLAAIALSGIQQLLQGVELSSARVKAFIQNVHHFPR